MMRTREPKDILELVAEVGMFHKTEQGIYCWPAKDQRADAGGALFEIEPGIRAGDHAHYVCQVCKTAWPIKDPA